MTDGQRGDWSTAHHPRKGSRAGQAWRGKDWPGTAGKAGGAWQGAARLGWARQGRRGRAWRGKARQGRRGKAWPGEARQGRRGKAGAARQAGRGGAWHGTARQGWTRQARWNNYHKEDARMIESTRWRTRPRRHAATPRLSQAQRVALLNAALYAPGIAAALGLACIVTYAAGVLPWLLLALLWIVAAGVVVGVFGRRIARWCDGE